MSDWKLSFARSKRRPYLSTTWGFSEHICEHGVASLALFFLLLFHWTVDPERSGTYELMVYDVLFHLDHDLAFEGTKVDYGKRMVSKATPSQHGRLLLHMHAAVLSELAKEARAGRGEAGHLYNGPGEAQARRAMGGFLSFE